MRTVLGFIALLSVLVAPNVSAQYEIYDNFDRSVLNSKRWTAGSVGPLGAVEYARYLENGAMRMHLYGVADRTSTTGSRVRLRNRIYMHPKNTDGLSAFQIRARVDSARIRGCEDPASDVTRVRLFMDLLWFNDGRSTEVEDFEGDVFSSIELMRSDTDDIASDTLRIVGSVFRCEDTQCGVFEQLGESTELGQVKVGTTIDLSSAWDKSNGMIKWRGKVSGASTMKADFEYLSYVPNPQPTFNKEYTATIQVRAEVADCNVAASGSRNPLATMDASIKRVRIKRQN